MPKLEIKELLWILRPLFGVNYKKQVAYYIGQLCENNSSILDIGCNDGRVGDMMMKSNPSLSVKGIDIQNNNGCLIEKTLYDGEKIPYPDNSFDIVMANDMLHHTTDIPKILKEMKRVSRKYIIIKDVVIYSKLSHLMISFADYISNVRYGIPCTYNFPDWQTWNKYFSDLDLNIIEKPEGLKFGYFLNERYNPVMKLEK